jgi:hypothetical protein
MLIILEKFVLNKKMYSILQNRLRHPWLRRLLIKSHGKPAANKPITRSSLFRIESSSGFTTLAFARSVQPHCARPRILAVARLRSRGRAQRRVSATVRRNIPPRRSLIRIARRPWRAMQCILTCV